MNQQDNRRAQRRAARQPMLVVDCMTGRPLGRIGNLSEGGMLLLASEPVVEGALYQLQFPLPAPGASRETAIDAGVHVIWMGQAHAPGQSFAGLRFLTLSPVHHAAVRAWAASA